MFKVEKDPMGLGLSAETKKLNERRRATLLEGVGLAFDIRNCIKFTNSNLAVLKSEVGKRSENSAK